MLQWIAYEYYCCHQLEHGGRVGGGGGMCALKRVHELIYVYVCVYSVYVCVYVCVCLCVSGYLSRASKNLPETH